jgi:hypothetical protein
MLRSDRRAHLEARTTSMQPIIVASYINVALTPVSASSVPKQRW